MECSEPPRGVCGFVGGWVGAPHQCSLRAVACYLLFMLTRCIDAVVVSKAMTGPGFEGWYKSEFGCTVWPSFESIATQLPKDQWSMSSVAASKRSWNVARHTHMHAVLRIHVLGVGSHPRVLTITTICSTALQQCSIIYSPLKYQPTQ